MPTVIIFSIILSILISMIATTILSIIYREYILNLNIKKYYKILLFIFQWILSFAIGIIIISLIIIGLLTVLVIVVYYFRVLILKEKL